MKLPVGADSVLLPSLLTLSDVFCTGHHAAVTAGVSPCTTVTAIGDGAVGLCAVLAARRLGAERILIMGRHKPHRPRSGIRRHRRGARARRRGHRRVRELTGGDGIHTVLECVGTRQAIEMAIGVARDGGAIGRVGAAQDVEAPMDFGTVWRNITLAGGVAPARAYIEEIMPDVLDGRLQPGRVSTARSALRKCRTGIARWPPASR